MIIQSRREFIGRVALMALAAPPIIRPSFAEIQKAGNLPPNLPSILDGFAARPQAGTVAGVDYRVGCQYPVLEELSSQNIPPGTVIDTTRKLLRIQGENVILSGFNLDGYTILLGASARGTATVQNCSGAPTVIRTVVGARANLVVKDCTLDGGSRAGDFRLVTYFGNGYCSVQNCWLKNSDLGGVHAGGVTLTVQNNLFEQFGWTKGIHTNGVYVSGGTDPAAVITVTGNTFYSGKSRNQSGFPLGIGIGVSLFADGGNYYNSFLTNNTLVMQLPGSASAGIGYFNTPPTTVEGGNVQHNYMYSMNGFGPGRGCIQPFYKWAKGLVSVSYANNIDMATGSTIPPP
jgi:hypothetical protein